MWVTPKKQEEIQKPINPLKEQAEKVLKKLKVNERSQWITKNLEIILAAISDVCDDTDWKLDNDRLIKLEMNQQFKVLEATVEKGKDKYTMEVFCHSKHDRGNLRPADNLKLIINSAKTNYQKTIYFGNSFNEEEIRNFFVNN
jgi:Ribonuclease G/E